MYYPKRFLTLYRVQNQLKEVRRHTNMLVDNLNKIVTSAHGKNHQIIPQRDKPNFQLTFELVHK